jgi:predicted metalloenzyme YecM
MGSADARAFLADVPGFEALQRARCDELGIDVRGYDVSHVAVRCRTWAQYLAHRDDLERRAVANHENVWNGRPISKILLAEPLTLHDGRAVPVVELIPPPHQRVYRMGLEHVGYVVGPGFEEFRERHLAVLTGQQFQSPVCSPVYRLFADYTHVKFYERSLLDACVAEGAVFEGFTHADWAPADPSAGPYELS